MSYTEFCIKRYNEIYKEIVRTLSSPSISESKKQEIERIAQKQAIRDTIIDALKVYNRIEAADIWRAIYSAHICRKSGVFDIDKISNIISSDNSWKKSSGHAFEAAVTILANPPLAEHGIQVLLQKELSLLMRDEKIHNEDPDITWLNDQINGDVFDLYATVTVDEKNFVFGCIQAKTSIRDRVTRDREPSLHAMQHFFWSVAIVLDGDFLRMPKYKAMVNGGTTEHPQNGWHGMYVFSEKYSCDRIFAVDVTLSQFVEHAREAAHYWLTQRQWFNKDWRPK